MRNKSWDFYAADNEKLLFIKKSIKVEVGIDYP